MDVQRLIASCFLCSIASMAPMLSILEDSTAPLFLSRLFVESAFNVTLVYTPEAYPTNIRSYAVGVANIWSRLGGMLAPFISQDLLRKTGAHPPSASVGVYMAVAAFGAMAALSIPKETKGMPMEEISDEEKMDFLMNPDGADNGYIEDAEVAVNTEESVEEEAKELCDRIAG